MIWGLDGHELEDYEVMDCMGSELAEACWRSEGMDVVRLCFAKLKEHSKIYELQGIMRICKS